MNRLCSALLLVTMTVVLGAAQTQDGLKPPPRRDYRYGSKIVSSYEPAKDQTTVLIQLMPVKDVEDPRPVWEHSADKPRDWSTLDFTMFFTYPGKSLITPKYVSIGFLYEAFEPGRYKDHQLAATIDGEKFQLGKMEVLSTGQIVHRFAYKPYTRRTLELVVPYEYLLRFANAKKVKLILGKFDFNLSKDHLEAIKDLASRTVN